MKVNTKSLLTAAMLTALAVSLSTFAIPIGASKCFPIQHLCNVIAGVFLGPAYGVAMAFCTSLIRNLLGTGSPLAFPGSMVGAFLCGFLYQRTGRLAAAYFGLLCYPVATLLMGQEAALFAYVIPFLLSTAGGTIMAFVLISALYHSGAMSYLKHVLGGTAR